MPSLEFPDTELNTLPMGMRILVNKALDDAKRKKGTSMEIFFLRSAEAHQDLVEKLERAARAAP